MVVVSPGSPVTESREDLTVSSAKRGSPWLARLVAPRMGLSSGIIRARIAVRRRAAPVSFPGPQLGFRPACSPTPAPPQLHRAGLWVYADHPCRRRALGGATPAVA